MALDDQGDGMARSSSPLMSRGSQRARPGAGGGAGSVLLVFLVIAALSGGIVWYFYAGGPGSKKTGGIGDGYQPVNPNPGVSITIKQPL